MAFDAAVSERILSDERSAEAFEAAETAEALDQAMGSTEAMWTSGRPRP